MPAPDNDNVRVNDTILLSLSSPPERAHEPPYPTRQVPSLPFGTSDTSVTIKQRLQACDSHCPEICLGTAKSKDDKDLSFILKLYIPSKMASSERFKVRSLDDSVKMEAEAYEKLAEFQGSTVPYFFGTHSINLSSGVKAYVLAIEHIDPGTPLAQIKVEIDNGTHSCTSEWLNPELWTSLFKPTVWTIITAHKRGVIHGNVTEAKNFLWDSIKRLPVLVGWRYVVDSDADGVSTSDNPNYLKIDELFNTALTLVKCPKHQDRMLKLIKDDVVIQEWLGKGICERLDAVLSTKMSGKNRGAPVSCP
ncbi:hypothetical protein PM082_020390 [Marasmius tenuissimus]|nr:hypothetical protein PM082_020390 [Marasmius tenuissimus]